MVAQPCKTCPIALAKRYGINQKTVAKWKRRETVADLPTTVPTASDLILGTGKVIGPRAHQKSLMPEPFGVRSND